MATEEAIAYAAACLQEAIGKASKALESPPGDYDPPVRTEEAALDALPDASAAKAAASIAAEALAGLAASVAKDPRQVTAHFNIKEMYCECGGKRCNGWNGMTEAEAIKAAGPLFAVLEKGRAEINRLAPAPNGGQRVVQIKSGIRCKWANDRVGGASGSQHLKGVAADVNTPGVSTWKIWDAANPNGGVGYGGGNYPHVDARGHKSRWTY
jgi:hypothetical protein